MYIVDILYFAFGYPNHQITYWEDFSEALEYAHLRNVVNGEVIEVNIYERWMEAD